MSHTARPAERLLGSRGRSAVIVAVLVIVAVVAAIVWWPRSGGDKAPYQDAAATGKLGLCSASGTQVTSGSTKDKPFVWRAVGTTAATGAFAGSGRTATLYAYQPRAGVPADSWSGQQLTSAGSYSNPAHPMAAATKNDIDLYDFLAAYPARDNGFVQLRLYLGAPNTPSGTQGYDALDLKISGNQWHAVGGTTVDCKAGTVVSFEEQVQHLGTTP